MADALRTALIGYGLAGAVFHAPLIASTPGFKLSSVVTGNPERAAQARREHPDVRVCDSAEQLWAAADEHDLVVVAAPNRVHVPLGLAALEAGLPVVIDKPLAATAEQGRLVIATAQRRGLVLSVFHNRRWDGDLLTVRRLLAEDALGPVLRFESRYDRWRPQPRDARDPGAWRERGSAEEAGGLLYDLGSHLVDQALLLFGRPRTVYAELHRRRAGVNADDDMFVALGHDAEVRSHLWASSVAAALGPRMRLLGLKAAYVKHGLDVQEAALRSGRRPSDDPDWGREPRDAWGWLGAGDTGRELETEPGAYQRFYEGVRAAIRDGQPPPVDPADAVSVIEVIEAAQASARDGTVVTLA
jgi:predicted dehydrogenase